MDKETVQKVTEDRTGKTDPAKGEEPSQQTDADVGAITRGSGDTKAHQTTSTSFPKKPVPESFLKGLGEMHAGEKELTEALPAMADAAKSKDLKALLETHRKETEGHVRALEQVAESLGKELPEESCEPVTNLIKEGKKAIGDQDESPERDAAIIAVGQKVEQFEIGAYEPLCATAREMDWTHELALLTSILNQEKLAEDLLGSLGRGEGPLDELVEKASLKHGVGGSA